MKILIAISIIAIILLTTIMIVNFSEHTVINNLQLNTTTNSLNTSISLNTSTISVGKHLRLYSPPPPIVKAYNISTEGIYLYNDTIYVAVNYTVNSLIILNQTYVRQFGQTVSPVDIGIQVYGIDNVTLYKELLSMKEVNVSIYDGEKWIHLTLPVFTITYYLPVICYLSPASQIQPY